LDDIQEQLAILRRRIAKIDPKYARDSKKPAPRAPEDDERRPARYLIEQWMSGEEVETPTGRHFESERVWERHRRHGNVDISHLFELPEGLLEPISDGAAPRCPPTRWAFLDTETTGLAGGAGAYAFLVGIGRITEKGFHLRQFFMRDYGEELSLLHAIRDHLAQFDVLITYNGKTYDEPLLEGRYRMAKTPSPFGRLEHVDILFGARRLWKLRFESCRLVELENQVLGFEREGDVPGELIPYLYLEYLRRREAFRLAPVFHHNAMDILTLACLTAIVPHAFHAPGEARLCHGAEMVGLARWLRQAERYDDAIGLFRQAVDRGLPDDLMFRTLWDIALLEKKQGREVEAIEILRDLAGSRNPFRKCALEELAKFYEHRERNYGMALEMTRSARSVEDCERLRVRESRLERRLASPRAHRRVGSAKARR
jgi:uncharacterized protein YprB with RNaseH-like and TPR domain